MKKIKTENPFKAIHVFIEKEAYDGGNIVILKVSSYDENDAIYLQPDEALLVAEKLQEMVKKYREIKPDDDG